MDANRVNQYKWAYEQYDKEKLVFLLSHLMEMMDRFIGISAMSIQQTSKEVVDLFADSQAVDKKIKVVGDPSLN